MSVATSVAECIRRRYRLRAVISESAIDEVIRTEGLRVVKVSRDCPVGEFRRGRIIGIRTGQSEGWRKWLKAHALGHYLLHRGDQSTNCDELVMAKQERQADLFAGSLLIGHTWCESPWQMAEEYGLPVECVERWLEVARTSL